MKDPAGVVVYVGKAIRLPDRVSSYFVPSADLGPKKQRMLDLVDDFDTIECEGEWEALLIENRLIKDIHPRFNVRLTDDKTFPYLVITTRDDFPGVFITRQPSAPEFRGAKVFGPFTSVYALHRSIQVLQQVFQFRTCELEIRSDDPQRRRFRPCLLHAIKRCTAPCADKISQEQYRADIDRFIRLLESKRSVMLREMRQEMEEASKSLQFEKAATLRDQVRALESLDQRGNRRQLLQPETELPILDLTALRKGAEALRKALDATTEIRCIECIDIAHLQGGETVGSKVCFIDGRPFKNAYRRYRITVTGSDGGASGGGGYASGGDDYAAIREVISRRYRDAGEGQELYPDLIIIDGGLGQLHAAMEVFATLSVKPPLVVSLAKKEELIYHQARSEPIRLPRTNPGLRLCQAIRDEAHRFAQHYHHLLRRKSVLGENSQPRRSKKQPPSPTSDP
ncbi:MAG: UvrB/UvrC motif-containing protein [Phycisphaeraceae bacterium]|nr:UvrB/UvrC motif-containing protein [Phycisphaeraceae bacterium]